MSAKREKPPAPEPLPGLIDAHTHLDACGATDAESIRVILDLVAGHTSIAHPWFQRELQASGPDPEGDRYVWRSELPGSGSAPESADEPQPVAATPIRAAAATETRIRFIGLLLVLRHIGLSDVITTIFIAACGAVRPAS